MQGIFTLKMGANALELERFEIMVNFLKLMIISSKMPYCFFACIIGSKSATKHIKYFLLMKLLNKVEEALRRSKLVGRT